MIAEPTPVTDTSPDAAGDAVDPRLSANTRAYRSEEALARYTATYGLNSIEQALVDRWFRQGDRLVDLACGGGRTTVPLDEQGFRVIGLDLSEPLITAARRRFPAMDFRVGDYCATGLEGRSFDAALISYNGLDYAVPEEQRAAALEECARLLVPGGRLIFSSHNVKSLHGSPYYWKHPRRLVWMLRQAATAFRPAAYVEDLNDQWTYFASPEHVHGEVDRAGFDLVDMVGFRHSRSRWFNRYISPWVHYVCLRRS